MRAKVLSKRGFIAIYDNNDIYGRARQRMVETQLIPRGIKDQRVINAMLKVPRHLFVEEGLYDQAYNDYPLPIGGGQTISQPYMVALMTEALGITSSDNILEIGTGSGYQTAILSKLAGKVYSIERIPVLASKARKVLDYLSCPNVIVKISDGTVGWPEYAPFNGIIVAAASPALPEAYIEQMADDGVLIIPVGSEFDQNLMRFKKTPKGIVEDNLGGCKFVKLVGKFGWSN